VNKFEMNFNNSIVHGSVNQVQAERIENSFNSFKALEHPDELTKAVEELHRLVGTLVAQMGEGAGATTGSVTRQLEIFTEQAGEKEPIPGVLRVTGQGLIDAAKTMVEVAGPVASAVNKILELVGVSPIPAA
jgi:hypothetical protein